MKSKCYVKYLLVLFLCSSCMHSRTTAPSFTISAGIKILTGSAMVKIKGEITENLYHTSIFDTQIKDEKYYDNPSIAARTITKNEVKYLSTGEEYKFDVLPTEVVFLNITSLDGNDVEIISYQYEREKKYILKGTNRLGLIITFQNR